MAKTEINVKTLAEMISGKLGDVEKTIEQQRKDISKRKQEALEQIEQWKNTLEEIQKEESNLNNLMAKAAQQALKDGGYLTTETKSKSKEQGSRTRRTAEQIESDKARLQKSLTAKGQSKTELMDKAGYEQAGHFSADMQALLDEGKAKKEGQKRSTVYLKA